MPRQEVYEKAGAELDLGTLELNEGPAELRVRASELPGAVEVIGVQVERVE